MAKKSASVQFTADELAAMRARGESGSDWVKAAATTKAQLEASIAADPDEAGMDIDWDNASIAMPEPKAILNMRVDQDVLAYFKKTGRGYQTRINAVLRAFVNAQRRPPKPGSRRSGDPAVTARRGRA
jgi:uncharacterized protein (DUF4415 family)